MAQYFSCFQSVIHNLHIYTDHLYQTIQSWCILKWFVWYFTTIFLDFTLIIGELNLKLVTVVITNITNLLGLTTHCKVLNQYVLLQPPYYPTIFCSSIHKHCKCRPCFYYHPVSLHILLNLECSRYQYEDFHHNDSSSYVFYHRVDYHRVVSYIHGNFFLPNGRHDFFHQLLNEKFMRIIKRYAHLHGIF